jgi:hypothetical protein
VSAVNDVDGAAFSRAGISSPCAKHAPDCDQFAEVVGIVVDDEDQLAQIGLTRAVRDAGEQIDFGIRGETLQRLEIAVERSDSGIPSAVRGRRGVCRPVVVGPLHFAIVRVEAEVENIVLRDADVLHDLPRRMRHACRAFTAQTRREAGDRIVEVDVRVTPVERLCKKAGKGVVLISGSVRLARVARFALTPFAIASRSRCCAGSESR